jgi:hypothetical protein
MGEMYMGLVRNTYIILVGNLRAKIHLEHLAMDRRTILKLVLEVGYNCVDLTKLAHDMVQGQAL